MGETKFLDPPICGAVIPARDSTLPESAPWTLNVVCQRVAGDCPFAVQHAPHEGGLEHPILCRMHGEQFTNATIRDGVPPQDYRCPGCGATWPEFAVLGDHPECGPCGLPLRYNEQGYLEAADESP